MHFMSSETPTKPHRIWTKLWSPPTRLVEHSLVWTLVKFDFVPSKVLYSRRLRTSYVSHQLLYRTTTQMWQFLRCNRVYLYTHHIHIAIVSNIIIAISNIFCTKASSFLLNIFYTNNKTLDQSTHLSAHTTPNISAHTIQQTSFLNTSRLDYP